MKTNKIREMLKSGKPTVCTRINSRWPSVTELIGMTGCYDYIEFLAEYAPFDQFDLENIPRAAELHGMGSLIKIDFLNRGYVAQRAIASGFQAVLFTDHRNAAEVRETLKMIRPECPGHGDGIMGFANRRWIGHPGVKPQLEWADSTCDVVLALMIEKKEAIENIEEICAVPEVDMVQFGPYDYALSCGYNAKDNQDKVKDAEKRMIETALKHGVRPRCEIRQPEQAEYYMKLGVKDIALGSELAILLEYWQGKGETLRKMMGDNGLK